MAKNKRKKYYAVAKGHKTGVYKSWGECKEQVDGFSGNQYKGFATESQATDYIQKTNDTGNNASSSTPPGASSPTASYTRSITYEGPRKRIRRDDYSTKDHYKQTRSTPPTSASTPSSHVSTPYESSCYAYFGAQDEDDPLRDYYHSHGFYGFR
ncbi:unnamed protein product [Cylindrotheca closterium]|uniref:Ribonuclease H n=1 Tax=Cylindrotheca closterium TaxID=2856 RepID=A0AAD2CVV8_9STRA|nr:unnamed protein product [Cylindrotheca closterium]